MENNKVTNNDKSKKRIYEGIIIALIVIIGGLAVWVFTTRKAYKADRETAVTIQNQLQTELDSVLTEFNTFKMQHDSILVDKDSIIQNNAQEIRLLIAQQADYFRIRRQLNLLREVTQNYVQEIDSLVSVNQVLRAENVAMREEIQVVTSRYHVLEEERTELRDMVEMASVVRAHNFDAQAVRIRGAGREEVTDRASRAEQIKVSFTLAENPVARSGDYRIFMRIADPAGNILRVDDGDTHAFMHGSDTLQFSSSTIVNYQNQQKTVQLVWQRIAEFTPGVYLISFYTDEHHLGETALTLR
ncbi:MAG TPA: hypothetical protein VLH37_10480 [Bacteroidales bacterium]|nr:hypothetical protein [Bacteroidales bacterium]